MTNLGATIIGILILSKVTKQWQHLFKGAVSRNSAKLGNYKMPVKSKRHIKITA